MLPGLVVLDPVVVALLGDRLPVLGVVTCRVRAEYVIERTALGRMHGDLAVEVPVPLVVAAHISSVAHPAMHDTAIAVRWRACNSPLIVSSRAATPWPVMPMA